MKKAGYKIGDKIYIAAFENTQWAGSEYLIAAKTEADLLRACTTHNVMVDPAHIKAVTIGRP
jgi:hypothetical protein